jgi:hypothetical protein
VPISNEEAAEIAKGIGRARNLRPGQLPSGAQFAEGLNGLEECAGFIARVGQPRAACMPCAWPYRRRGVDPRRRPAGRGYFPWGSDALSVSTTWS